MPLPHDAFHIKGGCNCGAVRYEALIPPFSERPATPYHTPGADIGDLRIPGIYIDHCNDCRRATSSILPTVLVCDIQTVQVSLLSRSADVEKIKQKGDWVPAAEIFDFRNTALEQVYLTVYKSSEERSRWFCSRCGTMLAYSVDPGVIPPEWGWPTMLDIWLGTVDREDLEPDYMRPERMLWCEKGVPWIRELARSGAGGIPEHPLTKIDVCLKEK